MYREAAFRCWALGTASYGCQLQMCACLRSAMPMDACAELSAWYSCSFELYWNGPDQPGARGRAVEGDGLSADASSNLHVERKRTLRVLQYS